MGRSTSPRAPTPASTARAPRTAPSPASRGGKPLAGAGGGVPPLPAELARGADFGVLLVLGGTGSGKTRFARAHFGEPERVEWDAGKAIVSQFGDAEEAQRRLTAVGLGSIPAWHRPFHCLSNGEQARALLARQLRTDAVIDDFTAWVNREAAKAMAAATGRFVRQLGLRRVVVCSPCADIVPWLGPDHVLVLPELRLHVNPTDPAARRPVISVACESAWEARAEGEEGEHRLLQGGAQPAPKGKDGKAKAAAAGAAAAASAASARWPLLSSNALRVSAVHDAEPAAGGAGCALKARVAMDEATERASEAFDFEFDGATSFTPPTLPAKHFDANPPIAVIVGPSGSGKTTVLRALLARRGEGAADAAAASVAGAPPVAGAGAAPGAWAEGVAVREHFESAEQAAERLRAVLLPEGCWGLAYAQLSAGEQFQAALARELRDGGVVDEFTSAVDRTLALRVAHAVGVYARARGLRGLVLASCHEDFVAALQPQLVFSTLTRQLAVLAPEQRLADGALAALHADEGAAARAALSFEPPAVELVASPRGAEKGALWGLFAEHHYLSHDCQKGAHLWLVTWGARPVGCVCAISFPGTYKCGVKAWREHRTVLLPDYQGLGAGVRMVDAVAGQYLAHGWLFMSTTAHPRVGEHRQGSALWAPTARNLTFQTLEAVGGTSARIKASGRSVPDKLRVTFSHRFVGTGAQRAAFRAALGRERGAAIDEYADEGGRARAKAAQSSLGALREQARQKSKEFKARVESGEVKKEQAWSKGGVSGMVKPEGLFAFCLASAPPLLRLGKGCLALAVGPRGLARPSALTPKQAKETTLYELGVAWEPGVYARDHTHSASFSAALRGPRPKGVAPPAESCGSIQTLGQQLCNAHGVRAPKGQMEVWRCAEQGGTSLYELRERAVARAVKERVNPRSIEEWGALGRGDTSKIRRLGANAEHGGAAPAVAAPKGGGGAKPPLRRKARAAAASSSDDDESESESESEDESSEEEEEAGSESSAEASSEDEGGSASDFEPARKPRSAPAASRAARASKRARAPKPASPPKAKRARSEEKTPTPPSKRAAPPASTPKSPPSAGRAMRSLSPAVAPPASGARAAAAPKPAAAARGRPSAVCAALGCVLALDEALPWKAAKVSWQLAQKRWVTALEDALDERAEAASSGGGGCALALCAASLLQLERCIKPAYAHERWARARPEWARALTELAHSEPSPGDGVARACELVHDAAGALGAGFPSALGGGSELPARFLP